ncbi:MAG: hypothetical protein HS104_02335 [Polyangiaceae bacterium]|nr:hypothetical protein [Polyangiaceae bacterium]MCE7892550.1 hypothetical protein [Sorangiineae bacterium PRO1]MCL4751124.1 hypothetical protein [Myxococcales bacterium]
MKAWIFLLPLAVMGCPTKEAEDPQKILGDWTEHGGADGTVGARGVAEPRSEQGQLPAESVASKAECQAAARRIEELALELAVKEAEDPEERRELEARRQALLKSPAFAARVREAGEECLSRDTTQSEARCVARAKSELDVDRCSGR